MDVPVGPDQLMAGDWVWMPLAVWKHETTRWGGLTYFTPGPADPPPPERSRWLYGYAVASWQRWPGARDLTIGERIEVEMAYVPITREDGSVREHLFYRREFDLNVKLRNLMLTWATPRVVVSYRERS